jgi:hypothetical protein
VKLHATAIDDYELRIVTDPQVTDWEASFDRGKTWFLSTPDDQDPTIFRWLVAGAKAVPDPLEAQPLFIITQTVTPIVRLNSDPRTLVRSAEKIRYFE